MTKIETILANFSKHNDLLRELGYKDIKDYICPICLKHFSMKDTEKLSLEDAPPKALGGKKIAITCKTCNNTCGHEIDNHLVNAIHLTDINNFVPGATEKMRIIRQSGVCINVIGTALGENTMGMNFPPKTNNPKNISDPPLYEKEVIEKRNLTHANFRKATISALKTAYMILFSKFGYTFLLEENYNVIREQILNPNENILQIVLMSNNPEAEEGIYKFQHKDIKGFFIIFSCKYQTDETHKYLVIIPCPTIPYEKLYENRDEFAQTVLRPTPLIGDYLTDINLIEAIYNWCYTV